MAERVRLAGLGVKNSDEDIRELYENERQASKDATIVKAKTGNKIEDMDVSNRIKNACHAHLKDGKLVWYSQEDHNFFVTAARMRRNDPSDLFMAGADDKAEALCTQAIKVGTCCLC